jgi:hypothetical protein
MKTPRMTANSRRNLESAHRALVVQFDVPGAPAYGVQVWVADTTVFICNAESVMLYPSVSAAERAVQRIRSDFVSTPADPADLRARPVLSLAPAPESSPAPVPAPVLPPLHFNFEVTRDGQRVGFYQAGDCYAARNLAAIDLGYASEEDMTFQLGTLSGLWARVV